MQQSNTGFMKALKCRECGREYPLAATHVCEFDFGPLEVVYDYDRIKKSLTRATILSRAQNMWRYRELLPVANDPTVGCQVGYTPLVKADRLADAAKARGHRTIEARCHPGLPEHEALPPVVSPSIFRPALHAN